MKWNQIIKITYACFRVMALLVLLYSCSGTANDKNNNNEREELLNTVDEFNAAFKTCDIETLASLIPETYRHTNGNSEVIGKQDWIAYLRKRKEELTTGRLVVDTYSMNEKDVVFYGNTAILTGRVITSGSRLGKPVENEYRVTNIWIKENGSWKRAAFHDGKVR